ncbi:NAD-dependent epimerase/dehydratase family protein [Oribacterium sp. HCP3S3_B9]|uniref:NAD-dependent epimerase/dehydratase family protein n=1 Tax=Oribacterium sp. HCP3S3_B9 TaxID=3438946 RepID=UPI003F8B83B6
MRVLITGVTSFLGLYTAKLLLQEGHEVIGAVRPGSRRAQELDAHGISAYPTYRTVHLDLSELPEAELGETHYAEVLGLDQAPATPDRSAEPAGHSGTAAAMQAAVAVPARSSAPAVTAPPFATHLPLPALADDAAPLIDAWIHFAWDGVGSAGRSDTNIQIENIQNAKKAYLYAKLLGARKFLFAGSQAEYGRGNHRVPLPVSPYGKAKLSFGRWATEQSLLSEIYDDAPMQFIHMRIYSVYGSGDHETSLVNTVLRAALRHEAIILGPCEQRWNYLEVHDLARAIRILLSSEDTRTGIYDIAGSDSRMLKKYVIAMNAIAARFAANADTTADGDATTAAGATQAASAGGQTTGTAATAAPSGAELRFGTRANNAEGAANMSPEILKLQRLGFHQEISFEAGIGMLLKTMREEGSES